MVIYDSADESYLTSSFSSNEYVITIEITKRVLTLELSSDSMFVDIDNLSKEIPAPLAINLASGDRITFSVRTSEITRTGDYRYWDICSYSISNKQGVDVLFCYEINIVNPDAVLHVYQKPQW